VVTSLLSSPYKEDPISGNLRGPLSMRSHLNNFSPTSLNLILEEDFKLKKKPI
jgi:hypothetical protein